MIVFVWKENGYVVGWSSTRQDDSQSEMDQIEAEESRGSNPEKLSADTRINRNARLESCDWTMLADAPLSVQQKTEWAEYRQLLREVPQQTEFPASVIWPEQP